MYKKQKNINILSSASTQGVHKISERFARGKTKINICCFAEICSTQGGHLGPYKNIPKPVGQEIF